MKIYQMIKVAHSLHALYLSYTHYTYMMYKTVENVCNKIIYVSSDKRKLNFIRCCSEDT